MENLKEVDYMGWVRWRNYFWPVFVGTPTDAALKSRPKGRDGERCEYIGFFGPGGLRITAGIVPSA